MKNAKQVVVIFQDVTDCNDVYQSLKQLELSSLVLANNVASLRRLIDQGQASFILFSAPLLPLALMVANIRALLGTGGLIVVSPEQARSQASELLLAGADVTLGIGPETHAELLAWKTALTRRAEMFLRVSGQTMNQSDSESVINPAANGGAEAFYSTWRLIDGGWRLLSPGGAVINLTYSEKFFLSCFVGQADKRIAREQLLEQNAIQNQSSRAVDSLISRLRRKASEQGFILPIKSIHGWGYSFIGLLLMENSSKTQLAADPSIDAFYEEVRCETSFKQQLDDGRFDFIYRPIVASQSEESGGATVTLLWYDVEGKGVSLDAYYHYLVELDLTHLLFVWVLDRLKTELDNWHQDYELDLPIYLAVPVQVLRRALTDLQQIMAQSAIQVKLHFVIYDLAVVSDYDDLAQMVKELKKEGIGVWLRYEGELSLEVLKKNIQVAGLSLNQLEQIDLKTGINDITLKRALEQTKTQRLPVMCEAVNSKEDRDKSQWLAAQYIAGDAVSLPLGRDGLLLAWASHNS